MLEGKQTEINSAGSEKFSAQICLTRYFDLRELKHPDKLLCSDNQKDMKSKANNSTVVSILLGFGALVGAFILIMSDPQQGGQIMQQVQQTAASMSKPAAPQMPMENGMALSPEGRLDGMAPQTMAPQMPQMPQMPSSGSSGSSSLSSAEAYLDSAWKSPAANVPSNTMQRFPQQQRGGFGQRGFPQQGFGQGGFPQQGGFPRGGLNQMINQQPDANQNSGVVSSARDAVNYELSYARAQASQASACMDRAQNAQDSSEKSAAASEARSHASSAMAAASRAASRAGGIPELQGLIGQIRNVANQAQSSAQQAASAAGNW
jgi:hypothetical protein